MMERQKTTCTWEKQSKVSFFFIISTFRNQYIKLHGPTTTVYGHSANFCLTRMMA